MGDPAGIGAEVALKSLGSICKKSIPVLIGDVKIVDYLSKYFFKDKKFKFKNFKQGRPGDVELIDLGLINDNVRFGLIDAKYGNASYQYIIEALKLIFSGDISAMVTCPINKMSIHSAGIPFMGHTELLAHFGGVRDYIMMMANRKMRVSLVSIHIPLKDVPGYLSADNIFTCISVTCRSMTEYFHIKKPRIKVCGLNPHAGEQGIMGNEERMIHEAISRAKSSDINVEGPFPADTLFHRVDCDAYIAMYHDQGLIPVKTTGFEKTVNITLGLPFVRTSPGHGTGYDIAGKGTADPSGLIEAYKAAEKMISL
jgi:4-hydroxythreonine-4-phosphate dehydrogenase